MPSAASYPELGDFPYFSHKRCNHIVDENFVVSGPLHKTPVVTIDTKTKPGNGYTLTGIDG